MFFDQKQQISKHYLTYKNQSCLFYLNIYFLDQTFLTNFKHNLLIFKEIIDEMSLVITYLQF